MSYASEVLADSPTAYWHLDDAAGATVTDASGNGHTGTTTGASVTAQLASLVPSMNDGSMAFGDTSSYVNLATSGLLPSGNFQQWTVECWFKTTALGGTMFDIHDLDFVNNPDLSVGLDGSGHIISSAHVSGTQAQSIVGSTTSNDGNKHHLVVVASLSGSTTTIHIYLDGAEVGAYSTQTAANISGSVSVTSATISAGSGNGAIATLDEVAWYCNTALSSTRILAHYNAGISPNNNLPISGSDSATLTDSATVAPSSTPTSSDAGTLAETAVVQVGSNASEVTPQRINVEIDWADAGAFTYLMEVLVDQPVAYWRLGELSGTAADDLTGNGHTGTYHGSPNLGTPGAISGDLNTAITLNGTNEYVEIPDA